MARSAVELHPASMPARINPEIRESERWFATTSMLAMTSAF
ncbi:hypothetical protein SS05631_c13420 [Sinorhizobium sp. CCBAU 05631]|nr:hypothetical protein SS05631_c13420 [Sinorhizobium sp. CCBAU 05631]